jgi:plastocyanin
MIGRRRIEKTSSLIPSLNLSATQVSGAVVAAMIAASIGLVALGLLTYIRTVEPFKTWLVPYAPAAQYGGIFLYTKVIWGIVWVGLFFALRHRQNMGNLRSWLLFFLIALGVGTVLAVASLDWSQLTTIMQFGIIEPQVTTTETSTGTMITDEISIKILEGSSIQGNPSYDPYEVRINRDDMVTWVNADTAPHTVTSGVGIDDAQSGELFDSGSLGQGQKFSIPAEQLVGEQPDISLDYYCTVHPFMKGKITVQ